MCGVFFVLFLVFVDFGFVGFCCLFVLFFTFASEHDPYFDNQFHIPLYITGHNSNTEELFWG